MSDESGGNPPIDPLDDYTGGCVLAIGGILFIPIGAAAVWTALFELPKPQSFFEVILHLIAVEFAISWLVFFTVGFFWGITGSRSLKRLVDIAASRIAWIIVTMLAIAIAGALVRVLWNALLA